MGEKIRVNGKPLIFGELVKLTEPILVHYKSDLFYDALSLFESFEMPNEGEVATFWYGVRDTGTNICFEREYFNTCRSAFDGNRWFEINVSCRFNDNAYDMTIEEV